MNFLSKSTAFSVADVMQTDVYTLSPETPVGAARMLADGKHVNHLLVVEHEMLAGILCKEDLCRADQTAPVRDCMTTPVPCVGPETTLRDAAGIMDEQSLSCLAVVIGALLVGIITRAELVELGVANHAARAAISAMAEASRQPEPWDPPWRMGAPCVACGSQYAVYANAGALETPLCPSCSSKVCHPAVRGVA